MRTPSIMNFFAVGTHYPLGNSGRKSSKTHDRKMNPLFNINDNYPKYIISMDSLGGNENGIRRLRLVEGFLLENESAV